jgi:hypothetical protein
MFKMVDDAGGDDKVLCVPAGDVRWNDITYYYALRLRDDTRAQGDYVVHAGVPRTLRLKLQYAF